MNSEEEFTVKTNDLLTGGRTALFLGIHRQTLWRWVCAGKIKPVIIDNQRFFHINELKTIKESREAT